MNFELKQIVAWDGGEVPTGWAICNGQTANSIVTPDIRGRYVKGASIDGDLKNTEGAETHTHTNPANAANVVANAHTGHSTSPSWSNSGTGDKGVSNSGDNIAPNHNHSASISCGAASAGHGHSIGTTGTGTNIPEHIKLLFIMYVGT